MWRNGTNGNRGSLQSLFETYASDEYKQLQDYAFDAYVVDDLVFVAVTAARVFEDGFPKRNTKDETNQFVYLTALAQVNGVSRQEANLTTTLPRGNYYNGSGQYEEHFFCCEAPRVDATSATSSMYYESVDKPHIDFVRMTKQNGTSSGLEIYGTLGRIMYSEDEVPYGATGFRLISGQNGMIFHNDATVVSGMGEGYVRTLIHGTTRSSTEKTPYGARVGRSFGFVALSRPKDSGEGESAIDLFEWEMNSNGTPNGPKKSVVLEKGYIDHFELIQTAANESGSKARRMVLYTAKETGPDGETRDRLYGLYIEPSERDGRNLSVKVTRYAYDLTLPTGKFSIANIGDTPYIYWMASAPAVDKQSEGVYRVWAAALDMSTNSVTTPSVFAEFKPGQYKYSYSIGPKKSATGTVEIVPHTVYLTGTGWAYFTAAADATKKSDFEKMYIPDLFLGAIKEQQKPVLEIQTMMVEDATVAAGDFEDTTVLLMNAGNMGISKFDLEFYTVENGKALVVETLHADLLHPEKSSLTMRGSSGPETLPEGKPAIYRNSDFDYPPGSTTGCCRMRRRTIRSISATTGRRSHRWIPWIPRPSTSPPT